MQRGFAEVSGVLRKNCGRGPEPSVYSLWAVPGLNRGPTESQVVSFRADGYAANQKISWAGPDKLMNRPTQARYRPGADDSPESTDISPSTIAMKPLGHQEQTRRPRA